jgi:branched-chain amino acid transport system substrate-binding protein
MLRVINDVGRFDISGDVLIVGRKAQDAPAKVFLTSFSRTGRSRP